MKRLSLFIYFFLITVLQAAAQQSFDKTAVKSVMKRVADWQIANPNKGAEHDDLDWTHAALYMYVGLGRANRKRRQRRFLLSVVAPYRTT